MVPHEYFEKMGQAGFMALWVDKKYGGAGRNGDFLYTVIKAEEYSKRGLNCIFSNSAATLSLPTLLRTAPKSSARSGFPRSSRARPSSACA